MRQILLTLVTLVLASCLCSGDVLVADLTSGNGASTAVGGQVTLDLNADGTIAASLVSYTDDIQGFGFATGIYIPEWNFSSAVVDNPFGPANIFGNRYTGFLCSNCGKTETWTIGAAGEFTTIAEALRMNSPFEFFFVDAAGNHFGASSLAPVPEPGTLPLLSAFALTALLGVFYKAARKSR
jgi:hypothetical protein